MANQITFNGLGSGIDFGAVRDAIIAQRQRPIAQLQNKVSRFNGRIDALKQLNGLLASVTSAAQNLTSRDVGTGRAVASTDSSIATATATSAAPLGNINLSVTRLASNFTQASRSYASANAPILAGGATSATFELSKGGTSLGIQFTIDSTNNSLTGLRDAINARNAGVTASIVDLNGSGTQQQLVLSSNETGSAGRIEITEATATGTLADLNLRSINPPDGDLTNLNAAFSVNGLGLTRSTNDFSDVISGVSFSLKKTGATNLGVTRANEVEEKLKAFVDAYNAVQDFFAEQYKKDAQGRPSGVLAGDTALRNAQQRLAELSGITSNDNGGSLTSLAQIGITATRTGKIELNSNTLKEKLQANPDDVRALLYGSTALQTGIFQSAYSMANGLSDNIGGSIQTAINGYQSTITSLNNTIASRTALLDSLRDSLTRRFAAADAAIGQLNGQASSLSNVIKSLQPK